MGEYKLNVCPVTLREAQEFVKTWHRHNDCTSGHKFSVGLEDDGRLIGVVTAGKPVARANDDGYTLEITRCCVLEGHRNANSMLYGAALRVARDGVSARHYLFFAGGKRIEPESRGILF
jgi:hypothetical protein